MTNRKNQAMTKRWHRIIAHVDMDAFFAAVEQHDRPELAGKPIGIVNGQAGTTVITASYEARVFGIKTGMHVQRAKALCPAFIAIASRPHLYAAVSTRFLQALQNVTPDIEIFSVDEAFLDLTGCKYLYRYPKIAAEKIQKIVYDAVGLTCSVGISGDKITAKFASKLKKPAGITIIPPWLAEEVLAPYPITALCGVGRGIAQFLDRYHVTTCGDMKNLPVTVLSSRFGNIGRRIWLMAQGKDTEPLNNQSAAVKSVSATKVVPPNSTDVALIEHYLYYCCDRVATRLRQSGLYGKRATVHIALKRHCFVQRDDYISAVNDETAFFATAKKVLAQWQGLGKHQGEGVYKVGIYVEGLHDKVCYQRDFFETPESAHDRLNAIKDAVNQRFGDHSICTAKALQVPTLSDVIAPSWKPDGVRNSVKAVAVTKKREGQA